MKKFLFCSLLLLSLNFWAAPGDTTHVITHNQTLVVTNPSTGSNGYKKWGVFPNQNMRKIYVTMKYKCPTNWNCGEWDYLDYVKIRRRGGVSSNDDNMEIVRFITPYGNTFNATWNFTWHMDVTEYAELLKDSVEIEYVHTGYETNSGKGWVVTLDFHCIEGTPAMPFVKLNRIFEGVFPYGDPANSIENYLNEDTVNTQASTSVLKLKVLQSGHGAGTQYCAEFCNKYRQLKHNGSYINTYNVFQTCGDNALYPQGGTWVYDRANWCPGDIVYPQNYFFNVSGGSQHRFDFDMQPYTNSDASQWPNYVMTGHVFEYGAPANTTDASIEEVIQPSSINEYNRSNPICREPKILVRNNGSNAISSLEIKYGIVGNPLNTYNWNGNLNLMDTVHLLLPSITFTAAQNNNTFISYISKVNGLNDQYPLDDTAKVKYAAAPAYDSVFIVQFYTNLSPAENRWELKDQSGNVLASRDGATCTTQTIYRDTVHLAQGCYNITVWDTGGDGLSWWANSAQGNGYVKLKKLNTAPAIFFKSFPADCGNFYSQNFTIAIPVVGVDELKNEISFEMYPNPAKENLQLDLGGLQEGKAFSIFIYNAFGQIVKQQEQKFNAGIIYNVSLDELNAGMYFIQVQQGKSAKTSKLIVSGD